MMKKNPALAILLLLLLPFLSNSALATNACIARTMKPHNFRSISPGTAKRWWRNFKNPSCCKMLVCHSSCSDLTGLNRQVTTLYATDTPCALTKMYPLTQNCGGACCAASCKTEDKKLQKAGSPKAKSLTAAEKGK